ncbi:MAG: 3-oxoacyl-[acyl-carrier-protein] reductase [Chloroflexi bacterium RBG_16_57_9]|nr:MAG: 3-oxoacyl-[acyl-carrier-protein] reductase [Chloroflexi bacterium RBG_16_57_9]
MINLSNKVALITGASRGIGRAIALKLAQQGAKIVINYQGNAAAAQEVVEAIKANGGEAIAVQADVRDDKAAQALIKATLDAFGRIDILVNNAGITRDTLLAIMKTEDWDLVLDTNLKGTFHVTRAAIRPMMKQRNGRIINITSPAGISGNPGQTNYSAAKAGVIGFTRAVAREIGSRGITVNAVSPGYILTDLTASLPKEIVDRIIEMSALKRHGSAADVAHAVAFLASDEAGWITGQVLSVDGGLVL